MLTYTRVTPEFCEPGLVAYVFERKLIVRQFQDDVSELIFALDLPGLFSQRVRCIEWRPTSEETQETDRSLMVASSDEILFYSFDGMLLGQIKPDFGVAAVKWVTLQHICIVSPNSLVADIYWIEPTQEMLGINHVIRVNGPKTTHIHMTTIDNFPVVNLLTRIGVNDSLTRVTIRSALEVTVDASSTFLFDTPGDLFKCHNGLFALADNPAVGHQVSLFSTSGHLLSEWEGSAVRTLPFQDSIISAMDFCGYEDRQYLATAAENVVSILSLRHLQPMKVLVQSILVTRDIFYVDCWCLNDSGDYEAQSTPYAPYSVVGVNSSFAQTPCDIPFLACSPQHGYIAVVCSLTPTTVWIWNIQDDAPVVHTVLCHDSEHTITALSWHPDKAVLMVQFVGSISSVWDMPAASGKHFPYRVKWLPGGMLLYDGQEFGLA